MEIGGSKSEAFKIAKKITDTIPAAATTIDEALKASKEFAAYCQEYPELETYGRKLVGLEKAYATHAAGIVIGDIDLSTYVPLRTDKNGDVSVQYEKNRCEEMGLIKMDLLGLEHLRILKNTIENVKKLGDDCLLPENLPLDDAAVWEDIAKGKTMCVFQMESAHMKALCKQVKPKNVEDLSIVNALGRPSAGQRGENGERAPRDVYIAIRSGKEEMKLKYPQLENSLGLTLGICMYEEQLMTLAKDAAGWSLNEADQLRKITKLKEKGKELAQKVEEKFLADAVKNGMEKEGAQDIWNNIIVPYSKYGFNKSLDRLEMIELFSESGKKIETKTIGELFETKNYGDKYVRSRDEMGKKDVFVEIKDVHDHGILDLFEFEMDNGKSVKCTLDHKFRVEDGRMLPIKQIIEEDLNIIDM